MSDVGGYISRGGGGGAPLDESRNVSPRLDGDRIQFVQDNRGRYWIVDNSTKTRHEVGNPGTGSYAAAVQLHGEPREGVYLTNWDEGETAVDLYGGPNAMEEVIAGIRQDPFTGNFVKEPRAVTTGSGHTYRPEGIQIEFVRDNKGRYWIADYSRQTRYEVGGPGSGSYNAAEALYGEPRRGVYLTNWNEGPTAVQKFGGPNEMEKVVAGLKPDPITGVLVDDPQEITTGSGITYTPPDRDPEDGETPGPTDDLAEEVARNAQEELRATLGQWFDDDDADALAEYAWDALLEGRSMEAVMIELQDHEVFRRRFPAIHERREARLSPISPAEYLEYEKSARQLAKASGMPRGLVEDRIDELIAGNVSLRSLSQRLEDGYRQAMDAPQEVRDELQRLGYTDGHLAGFFLDPDRGLAKIERDFRAGQVAGAAILSSFGSLDRSEAEQLVEYGAEYETALEGLSQLAESAQLFGQLPGEIGMEAIGREDQFAAQFGGDAEVRQRIERNVARRTGVFQGGGGAMLSQRGAMGLGAGGF